MSMHREQWAAAGAAVAKWFRENPVVLGLCLGVAVGVSAAFIF